MSEEPKKKIIADFIRELCDARLADSLAKDYGETKFKAAMDLMGVRALSQTGLVLMGMADDLFQRVLHLCPHAETKDLGVEPGKQPYRRVCKLCEAFQNNEMTREERELSMGWGGPTWGPWRFR